MPGRVRRAMVSMGDSVDSEGDMGGVGVGVGEAHHCLPFLPMPSSASP